MPVTRARTAVYPRLSASVRNLYAGGTVPSAIPTAPTHSHSVAFSPSISVVPHRRPRVRVGRRSVRFGDGEVLERAPQVARPVGETLRGVAHRRHRRGLFFG